MKTQRKAPPEINVGTTADIAFLLLIFFLVTTTIVLDKGLLIKLPPKQEEDAFVKMKERNIFKIQLNSKNQLMVNESIREGTGGLKQEIKNFVLNNNKDQNLSESPIKAVVSFKTNRGTGYDSFIEVLDEIKGTYYEIYAERAHMTPAEFRQLDTGKPTQLAIVNEAKEGIPMNISIAEPN